MAAKDGVLNFDDLTDFIQNRMAMSHVYQPVLLRTLIDAGGSATVRQIARAFAANDEAILREAEKTIRNMPVPVLKRHRIVTYDKASGVVSLNAGRLTFEQQARFRALCEERLGEYLERRGMGVWDYRLIDDSAVPYDLRYQVLAESERRCALCGATERERPLDVDHILPRSRGGTNERANLQILCSRCNRAKGNRDDRDFRSLQPEHNPSCAFCDEAFRERAIEQTDLVVAVEDRYPVTDGHVLIAPKRHTPDYFSMTQAERRETDDLLRLLRNRMRAKDHSVEGFNVGTNSGEVAGQTVPHAHVHLMPRRRGDVERPEGGVRGVIPERQDPRG
jgi:diadenosine tetraphosphate (Ap4A) HIT family hydrolase